MHDTLLACGITWFGAVIDIVLEGYDSLAASNSSARSLGMLPLGRDPGMVVSAREYPEYPCGDQVGGLLVVVGKTLVYDQVPAAGVQLDATV